MSDSKLTELEVRVKASELNILHIVERLESYHHDDRQQHQKLLQKVESLPTEDKMAVIMRNECEKLAKGLIKQIDEAKEIAHEAKEIAKETENEIKFAKRLGYGFAGLVAIMGWQEFINTINGWLGK